MRDISVKYDLILKTYLLFYVSFSSDKNLTFDANVEITIKVIKPTKKIVLNMLNIKLNSLECNKILITGIKAVKIKEVVKYSSLKKISVVLLERLNRNDMINLKMICIGVIGDTLDGLYQTTYTGKDGKLNVRMRIKRFSYFSINCFSSGLLLVTQFQPAYARRMVPCFDEPMFKANLTVGVIHPEGTTALSNGIEISEKPIKIYRVWSSPDLVITTQYALQAGIAAHDFFEKYFVIGFSLEKQGKLLRQT
ncbi:peptidase family M1 [Dictyocaulus viviparus]|uniref:Peptidase family M1 n=1 Tax=Dictyocaulus viviparus TaxID=29172 RepID=A0A0D8Y1U0_DICVI|nr:peptidase family M1 [Dictyocaulus viviparus]